MLSLPPFPTREDIENLLYTLDQYAPPLPNIREIVVHIYEDLSRYGPPVFPEINVPSLGGTIDRFVQVPAPPPPPPPPKVRRRQWQGRVMIAVMLIKPY